MSYHNILRERAERNGWQVKVTQVDEWMVQCQLTNPQGGVVHEDEIALNPLVAEDVIWDWYLVNFIGSVGNAPAARETSIRS